MAVAATQPTQSSANDRLLRNTEEQQFYIPLMYSQVPTDS